LTLSIAASFSGHPEPLFRSPIAAGPVLSKDLADSAGGGKSMNPERYKVETRRPVTVWKQSDNLAVTVR